MRGVSMARRGLAVRVCALAAVVTAAVALSGCGGSDDGGSASASSAPGADVLDKAKGPVEVEFWHSMKGANVTALNKIVSDFNAAHQGKIEVKAVFQGDYDTTIAKYKASVQQKHTPELAQIYDIGSRFMIDSKQTVPAYEFVAKDGYHPNLEPNIANYYTFNGKLQSMPFNSSMPLLYINTDLFRKAGLDPSKPPRNLDEIAADAKALTKKSGGRVTQYGFNAAIYGWYLEQLLATNGDQYCNASNGRKALADKVLYDSADGVKVAQWWSDLVKQGYASNTGRTTDAAQQAFKSGTVAMELESTGELRDFINSSKGKFTVAAAPFPRLTGDGAANGGTIIGGASLWIDGVGHTDAEKRASWEFVKYATSPAVQAEWHTGTGYFPVNSKALDEDVDKKWVAQYPQFQVAIDELHSTKPSTATAGCALGVMPQARKSAEDGLEKAITTSTPPQQAMSGAADGIRKPIAAYNKAVK
jgi:sn-glycerol 3-phosphate transport system substrate-binding protein